MKLRVRLKASQMGGEVLGVLEGEAEGDSNSKSTPAVKLVGIKKE